MTQALVHLLLAAIWASLGAAQTGLQPLLTWSDQGSVAGDGAFEREAAQDILDVSFFIQKRAGVTQSQAVDRNHNAMSAEHHSIDLAAAGHVPEPFPLVQVVDIFTRVHNTETQRRVRTSYGEQMHEQAFREAMQKRSEVCLPSALDGKSMTQNLDFHAQIVRGRLAAASKGIIFAGLLRNVGKGVGPLFATLRAVGQSFAQHHIIILENDSDDDTRERLAQDCQHPDSWCFLLSAPSLGNTTQNEGAPSRVYHLTQLRQTLLQQVREIISKPGEKWDYVLMFDGDMFNGDSKGFHPTMIDALMGLRSTLAQGSPVYADDPLDVVCANQVANWPEPARYRDTFALKNSSWYDPVRQTIDPTLYFKGNKLMPVKSCFGGLSLYRVDTLLQSECNYMYVDEEVCEHVPFHYCLASKGFGRVALYPQLVVAIDDKGTPENHCEALKTLPELASTLSSRDTAKSS